MTQALDETVVNKLPPKLLRLPAFPPVAIRALHLMGDDQEVKVRQLFDLLVADPVFCAELLRAANSQLYGLKHQIDSVQHAMVILGLERVRAITLTVATRFYLRDIDSIGLIRRCWRYNLACALLADELAHACSVFQDRAYTAALLHDIGRLALLLAHGPEYPELVTAANERLTRGEDVSILEEENQHFGIDHCEAGRLLALQWNLPAEFARIAGYHLDIPQPPQFDLLALVRLAAKLAISLGFGFIDAGPRPAFDDLREQIPEAGRHRFPSAAEELRESLQSRIDSYDLAAVGEPRTAKETAQASPPPAQEPSENAEGIQADAVHSESPAPPSPERETSRLRQPFRVRAIDIAVFVIATVVFGAIFTAIMARFLGQ